MKKKLYRAVLCFIFIGIASVNGADKGFSRKDESFFKSAASGGMMEVKLGEIAQQKAQSPDVKSFGERMVKDHTMANEELKKVAERKGITMPFKIEKKEQSAIKKLSKTTKPSDFDKEYMWDMVKDHAKDVTEFSKASEKLKDPDLKNWASKTLPVLEQHLQLARHVASKLGIDAEKAASEGVKEGQKNI